MSGKEKLYFLLERISDIREISPSGFSLIIDPTNDLNRRYENLELARLFAKLELDDKVLKIDKAPSRLRMSQAIESLDPYDRVDDGCWHIQLLPAFDNYYLTIQEQPEYQNFTGKTPPPKSLSKQIAEQFSPNNHPFVLMVLKEIYSLSEFSVDGTISYSLQSPAGDSDLIKERALLKKLESLGLFRHHGEDGIWGIARLQKLDVLTLREVIEKLEKKPEIKPYEVKPVEAKKESPQSIPNWRNDFGWEGDCYSFGKFGKTKEIISPYKKKLIDALAIEKGNWATIKKLKEATGKDEKYIRTTIGQIENSFDPELRKHLSIPSTLGADTSIPIPNQGAYRFALTP